MSKKEDEIILEEISKIIDSNKSKASSLRDCLLNLNQNNSYLNNLNFQIIQFLGEFEYDLKTLFELFTEYKTKLEGNFNKNFNSLFAEINTLKKENSSLKEIIENTKKKNNSPNKSRNSKSNKNLNDIGFDLKNKNIKKKIKEVLKNKKLNITSSSIRAYITNSNEEKKEKKEKENESNLYAYKRKNYYRSDNNVSNSEVNLYMNKSNTSNLFNQRKLFCDYNTYLTNLKHNSLYNTQINLIKYDNFRQNKNLNREAKSQKLIKNNVNKKNNFDKEKKKKIIFEIFQDEKLLNELKNQFGQNIENRLLNEDIDLQFFEKVEEISKKIKKKIYYTPKNKENSDNIKDENYNYKFKIPKRFSNHKNLEENNKENLFI
jgi:hypothetical protein